MKLFPLLGLGVTVACSSLVTDTLDSVSALDPLTADPAAIALAVDLPDSVALVPGSARPMLGARAGSGEAVNQAFVLRMQGDVLSVDPADHTDLRALQARIAGWKAADPSGTIGSLALSLEPCRTGDAVPDDARVSVAIRLVPDGPFLPLVENGPLRQVLQNASQGPVAPCR